MERRKDPRIQLRIHAQVSTDRDFANAIDGQILDISRSGAFVHCVAPILIGQEVHVRIFFDEIQVLSGTVIALENVDALVPDVPSSASTSVVRWTRGTSFSGFGMQFLSLDSEKRAFVEKLHECLRSAV